VDARSVIINKADNTSELRRSTTIVYRRDRQALSTARFCRTGQLATADTWFRPCRTSNFCTVAWPLARFQLTRRIARSLGDSWASCFPDCQIKVMELKGYNWPTCNKLRAYRQDALHHRCRCSPQARPSTNFVDIIDLPLRNFLVQSLCQISIIFGDTRISLQHILV